MSRRNLAVLFVLAASVFSGVALAQSAPAAGDPELVCKWCDRLPVYIKKYTYAKAEGKITDVTKVEYVTFETLPTVRLPEEGSQALTQLRNAQTECDHLYCVCNYHLNLELALAFASGDQFKKYEPAKTEGVPFPAVSVAGSAGATKASFSVDGSTETKVCVIEIDHPGYSQEGMKKMTEALPDDQRAAFAESNQATYRIFSMDPTQTGGDLREVKKGSIEKLGQDLAADGVHFRLDRANRPMDDTQVDAEARRAGHHFDSGSAWVVRTGEDPLRRILPRDEQYSKVKGTKEPGQLVKVLSEQLGEYVDQLLSECQELEKASALTADTVSEADWATHTKKTLQAEVLASQLDDARAHLAGLADMTFCQVNPNNPAVRVWEDHTDGRIPHVVGLSPMDGGYTKFDQQKDWDYILPYLAVIGVVLVSSVLSLFGIKMAG